jgi:hypothetical protein
MIEQVVVGLIVALFGALVIYAFRTKQLYLVIPRLFSFSELSAKGKLVEIRIFNKGKTAELDVQITLDPAGSYDIVASTDSTCDLKSSTIAVPRVAPGDDYSVLILVEGVDLTTRSISRLSSTTTKGKILNELSEVPPNTGNALLLFIGIILVAASPIAVMEGYEIWKNQKLEERIEELSSNLTGEWTELERYAESEFSRLYTFGEFPIHLSNTIRSGQHVTFMYKVINRAAAPLDLRIKPEWPFESEDPYPWESDYYKISTIQPHASEIIEIDLFWPSGKPGTASFNFDMSVGSESFLTAITEVDVEI